MPKKYRFNELYHRKRGASLPIDTNESVERSVHNVFKCEQLDKLLVNVREKRLYGEIEVYDQRGIKVCEMTVARGIIPKMLLCRAEGFPLTPPYIPLWKQSVLNDKIEMSKYSDAKESMKEQE